jgi:hypothetical protein
MSVELAVPPDNRTQEQGKAIPTHSNSPILSLQARIIECPVAQTGLPGATDTTQGSVDPPRPDVASPPGTYQTINVQTTWPGEVIQCSHMNLAACGRTRKQSHRRPGPGRKHVSQMPPRSMSNGCLCDSPILVQHTQYTKIQLPQGAESAAVLCPALRQISWQNGDIPTSMHRP